MVGIVLAIVGGAVTGAMERSYDLPWASRVDEIAPKLKQDELAQVINLVGRC